MLEQWEKDAEVEYKLSHGGFSKMHHGQLLECMINKKDKCLTNTIFECLTDPKGYYDHVTKYSNTKYICELCNSSFKVNEDKLRHERTNTHRQMLHLDI